ncbi:MAG: 4'-phosphopantetheinyl transferase superfamily protein [Tatlockia sp.]
MPPDNAELCQNRIDVWEFPLLEMPENAHELLNEEEQLRANRYYFARHKRRFTAARAMLRLILSRYVNKDAQSLRFSTNQYGKPALENADELQFNLSHSGDLALLAIGQHFPLGIDLEWYSARPYEGIANEMFSPEELRVFNHLPGYAKPKVFFEIWSKKEAFIKACGLGLSYPTRSITMPLFASKPTQIEDNLHQQHWVIRDFMPRVACHAALCHHPEIQDIRFIPIS